MIQINQKKNKDRNKVKIFLSKKIKNVFWFKILFGFKDITYEEFY